MDQTGLKMVFWGPKYLFSGGVYGKIRQPLFDSFPFTQIILKHLMMKQHLKILRSHIFYDDCNEGDNNDDDDDGNEDDGFMMIISYC